MKIEIIHRKTKVFIDDVSDDTRIKFNHELITNVVDHVIKTIDESNNKQK